MLKYNRFCSKTVHLEARMAKTAESTFGPLGTSGVDLRVFNILLNIMYMSIHGM